MTEGAGNQKSQERINYKTPEGIEVEVPSSARECPTCSWH